MSKWSFFFLLIPIFGVGIFAVADQHGWGLPENISTMGKDIDFLYYVILFVTGLTFIGTQLVLFGVLFKFGRPETRPQAQYSHGSRFLEIVWTVIPAIILLIIALIQMPAWIKMKFPEAQPNIDPIARVIGRQFEWRIIYPGPDGKLDTMDDIHVANELHVPMGRRVLVEIRSMDVLHSFFLPHARVKNDLVPGLAIPVWFDANKSSREWLDEHANLDALDFRDMTTFLETLKAGKTPMAAWLRDRLTPETRKELESYDFKNYQADSAITNSVLKDINAQMDSLELYSEERVPNSQLSEESRDHLFGPPGAVKRRMLNRQLLHDAFPQDIYENRHHFELACAELCGWGHYKMRGRLVVHESQDEMNAWLARTHAKEEATR